MSSIQDKPAQRLPAWKRLGLKLKGPLPDGSSALPPSQHAAAATPSTSYNHSSIHKRKDYPASTASNVVSTPKRQRIDLDPAVKGRRKSVTFANDTKDPDLDIAAVKTPSKPVQQIEKKKKKNKAKKAKPGKQPVQDHKPTQIQPELSRYLREWDTSRGTWKFKKNFQTLLIKYAFSSEMVPAKDFGIFVKYARDIKGASRDWLRNSAEDIRTKDQGTAAFPKGTTEVEKKQEKYEALLKEMLQSRSKAGDAGTNAHGKRVRDDCSEDLIMGGTNAAESARDPEVTQRLVKRLRAELVLEELCGGEASNPKTAPADSEPSPASQDPAGTSTSNAEAAQKPNAKDGKRRRSRNKRTLADDESSSSSGSDSDSSSSNDSSGDEDADDADDDDDSSSGTSSSSDDSGSESEGTLLRLQQQREELDTSSESSSSSDSGSDDASDEEAV